LNPSLEQLKESDIDMIIGASADSVMMVEGEMKEISEEEMVEAIKFAHEAIKTQCESQLKLVAQVGKKEVREFDAAAEDEALEARVRALAYDKVYEVAKKGSSKKERS
jgi:polyribonucleotide nucleotidyltransferase